MCEKCGCDNSGHHNHEYHVHKRDGHLHMHTHSHEKAHEHSESREITVEEKVLAANDRLADENRRWLLDRGVVAVNIISSPGSGKTMLLEKTLDMLKDRIKCAVITGDQQTDNDAVRLQGRGAQVLQIETYSSCHLTAEQISRVLPSVVDDDTKLLFIENVGNLVCPAAFDLGENFKVALLSTTEGEDKPVKYPVLFARSQAVIISKIDLIPHLDWDIAKCRKYIQQVHPGAFTFELSAKTGEGMALWIDYLKKITC
ncbi:MAG: hydrogenase accessory protein HypB [Lentisphaerae bacterium GWF2_44_16]|nr:MAG: hydrogenase accessory protein HypB [Lentisphaerae bacterium GWF2_44_16]